VKDGAIEVRIYNLGQRLQDYFSALYFFEIDLPDGGSVADCHYPDWAGLHFLADGEGHEVGLGDDAPQIYPNCVANGPTSRAMHVKLRHSRSWSLGLSPVGWARYACGPASAIANKVVDAGNHPAFENLAPLLDIVRQDVDDPDGTADAIKDFLCQARPERNPHEAQVVALHAALRDPAIGDVEGLVEEMGVSRRTIERLASRYFGFSPKLLLRRQRFLRSLGKFKRDPQRNWSASLDSQYVDQAHFVRDFRSFMGMTPSEYAQMPHPLLDGIFIPRLAEQGANPS